MSYQPLHHKYRPQTFGELVGQEAIATTLTNAVESDRIAPAYLFAGPRGTGKTSSARILAKSLNCLEGNRPTAYPCGVCEVCQAIAVGSAMDVIEIDAASNTGVDNIREIIERSQFAPVQCRYKVYAIDECHMLSVAAFNALLKTLEEPPQRVVFILATTDPQRVLPTIISRTQRFDFRRIPLAAMVTHLSKIAELEKIQIDSEAITLVAQIANGGLRDAQSLLDQLSLLSAKITSDRVWDLVGAVSEIDLLAMLRSIRSNQPDLLLKQCRNIIDRGREPIIVLQNLANFYLNLAIAKTAPESKDLVPVTSSTWEQLQLEAQKWSIETIFRAQKQLKDSEFQIKNSNVSRLWLEITLLGLLPSVDNCDRSVETPTKIAPQPLAKSQSPPVTSTTPAQKNGSKPPTTNKSQPVTPTIPAQKNGSNSLAKNNTAEISQNNDRSVTSLPELWQQVIKRIKLGYTQVLADRYCKLIAFDGTSATVEITTQKLYNQFYPRIEGVEDAFNEVVGTKVKINLQVAKNPTSQPTSNKTEKKQIPNPPAKKTFPAKNSLEAEIVPAPSTEEKKFPKTKIDFRSPQDLAGVAEKFAELFQGEIIDLDEILEDNTSKELSGSETESVAIPKKSSTQPGNSPKPSPKLTQAKIVGRIKPKNKEEF